MSVNVNLITRLASHPAFMLTLAQGLCGLIGLVQFMVYARGLGPELLGATAIVTTFYNVLINFFDVRFFDVFSKLYYETPSVRYRSRDAYIVSLILVNLIVSSSIAVLAVSLGYFGLRFGLSYFTQIDVAPHLLLFQGSALVITALTNTLTYIQRFTGRYSYMAINRILGQLCSTSIGLLIFLRDPGLASYFYAVFFGVLANFCVTFALNLFLWVRVEKLSFRIIQLREMTRTCFQFKDILIHGGLMGYTKMLHRAGDTLIVGYLFNDRVTGLYKLARSMTDALYMVYDVANQVFLPRLMAATSKKNWTEFHRIARHLVQLSTGAGIIGMPLAYIFLSLFVSLGLGEKYAGAEVTILVMMIPFFLVMAVSIWSWPVFLSDGRLKPMTLLTAGGALVQYLVIYLGYLAHWNSPIVPALGFLGYYLIVIPGSWAFAQYYLKGLKSGAK